MLYLEVPIAFRILKALGNPVHFYVLPRMPGSVPDALRQLGSCPTAFTGEVVGTNKEDVVNEGDAQWTIRDLRNPVLQPTTGRVFPKPSAGDLAAFIQVTKVLQARFDYVFDLSKTWRPIYDDSQSGTILVAERLRQHMESLDLIPAEHLPWHRVVGLELDMQSDKGSLTREASPESGRYVLFSTGRRFLGTIDGASGGKRDESATSADGESEVTGLASVPADVWFAASKWAKDNEKLEKWQRSLAYSLGRLAKQHDPASEKQTKQGRRLLLEAVRLGFEHAQLTKDILEFLGREESSQE